MKPSARIEEIHRALKILDGQDPDNPNFRTCSFFEQAICQYLDELKNGTDVEQRMEKK